MDRDRRIVLHGPVAIAIDGAGLWYPHEVPERIRTAPSSVAVAAPCGPSVCLTPGSVLAFFTIGPGSQVDVKLDELPFTAERRSPAE